MPLTRQPLFATDEVPDTRAARPTTAVAVFIVEEEVRNMVKRFLY